MFRLALAGPHTQILSSLCAKCPHASAGCCVAPPPLDWSDIGRVVALGGKAWLLEQIAAWRLLPDARGLVVARVKGIAVEKGPRVLKCTFHGEAGCTIPPERRAATCNYYVCDAVLDEPDAKPEKVRTLAAKEELARRFEAWDATLAREVAERGEIVWDEALLDWLGARFVALSSDGAAAPGAP